MALGLLCYADMFEALVVSVLFAPPIVAFFARKTRWWWTPSVALMIGGFIPFTQLDTTSHGGDTAFAGLGNFVLLVLGIGLLAYGFILLAITAATRNARRPQPPPPQ